MMHKIRIQLNAREEERERLYQYGRKASASLDRLSGLDDQTLYDQINERGMSKPQLFLNLVRAGEDLQFQVQELQKQVEAE